MKEITNVTTVQITTICKVKDNEVEEFIRDNRDTENHRKFEKMLKEVFPNADDIKIIEIQDFVRDLPQRLPSGFTKQTMNRFEKVD